MKQFITEAQRLQKLAGIDEIKIVPAGIASSLYNLKDYNFSTQDILNLIKEIDELKKEYLEVADSDIIHRGLKDVVNSPKLYKEVGQSLVEQAADGIEDEEDKLLGYAQDLTDLYIMREFAPQLAQNLLDAGFVYEDLGDDAWVIPNNIYDQWDTTKQNRYQDQYITSYGIIWEFWGVGYDTNIRENISEFLEDAIKEINPVNEIKIIPSGKISAIKDVIIKNFPEIVEKGSLVGASSEYFPVLLAVAKINGFNFNSGDEIVDYINNHANKQEEIKKIIYGFKEALDDLNIKVTVNEMKIIPSNPQLSKDELIEKIIDLYIDLYDDESDVLNNILSKYLSDRILYNANLSYKEMFETLDIGNLLKLYSELSRL